MKCIFDGSRTNQSCYTTNRDGKQYTFSGIETARGTVYGYRGETLTWKSSCEESAYTTMDGESEYAKFKCTNNSSSITILSPNGGETWQKGTTYTIKWQDNRATTCQVGTVCSPSPVYDITLSPYYPPCTENICPAYAYQAPRIIATNVSSSSYQWKIPNCTASSPCSSNFLLANS